MYLLAAQLAINRRLLDVHCRIREESGLLRTTEVKYIIAITLSILAFHTSHPNFCRFKGKSNMKKLARVKGA